MSDNLYVTPSGVESDIAPKKRTPQKRKSPPPNYKSVRTGLGIVYVAMIGLFLGLMGYLIYLFSFLGVNIQNISPLASLGFQVYFAVVGLSALIGFCFCCGAPKKEEKDKIQIVVALQVVSFLVAALGALVVTYAIGSTSDVEKARITLMVLFFAQMISLVSWFVFISFCKQLGIGSQQVTDATIRTTLCLEIFGCSVCFLWAILLLLIVSPPTAPSPVRNLVSILVSLVVIGSGITYSLMNVSMVQKTLDFVKESSTQAKFKKLPRRVKKQIQKPKGTSGKKS